MKTTSIFKLICLFFLASCTDGDAVKGPLPGMEFVLIPGGSFNMGSDEKFDEKPVHRVLVQPFYMMKTEVTQKMWIELMGGSPSYFKGDSLPVDNVSWNDCQEFIRKLNALDPDKGYRLPSEAEWEYACRAGATTRYYTGDSEEDLSRAGWHSGNSEGKIHPVGQKEPNAWGLYDMHGNVWEWCEDWYHVGYDGAPVDGSAWLVPTVPKDEFRVLRGGSWIDVKKFKTMRSASRSYGLPGGRGSYDGYGFRLARNP